MQIPAIVLAAGASRRLGSPKQLVPIRGETLLARTLRALREAAAKPVMVVLGANADLIASAVDLSEVQVILNRHWQQGISTSIRAGLAAILNAHPSTGAVLLLVCDQPSLSAMHLDSLVAAYKASGFTSIVASLYGGVPGIPAIFPASQFAGLQALAGDAGARQMLRAPGCAMITIPFAGGELDIDTPEDLEALS